MNKLLLTIILFLFPVSACSQNDPPRLAPLQEDRKAGWFSRMDGEFIVEIPIDVRSAKHEATEADDKEVFSDGRVDYWEGSGIEIQILVFPFRNTPATDAEKKTYLDRVAADSAFIFGKEKSQIPGKYSPGAKAVWIGYRTESTGYSNMIRNFIWRNKFYQVLVSYNSPQLESTALRFINSFRFVDADKIAEMQIAAAEPEPLPQTPVVKKQTSDAADEKLKGKVKAVYESSSDYVDGVPEKTGKKTKDLHFDIDGNLVRQVGYVAGAPSSVLVFGFLDEMRVYRIKYICHHQQRLSGTIAPCKSTAPEPKYSARLEYKYDENGRMIEKTMFFSDGNILRMVSSYIRDEIKNDFFNAANKHESSITETLGKHGFEVKQVYMTLPSAEYPLIFDYKEFDAQGNWTRRIRLLGNTVDGSRPIAEERRRIEYYK